MQEQPAPPQDRDRLLPWIAAERAVRAVLLTVVGIVLLTHPHTDWAHEVKRLVERLGLDPQTNWIHHLTERISRLTARQTTAFGVLAIAYGALEAGEAYGLWTRRRWGEWLTVIATSLLLVPELWELTKSVTALKLGGLLVNIAVVAYLIVRLRRQ